MKTPIVTSALCLAAIALATLFAPVAKADYVYTLSASGTVVGNFEWSVDEPSLITATTNLTSFLSTSSSMGCTISSATINMNYLGSGDPYIETFFSPACGSSPGYIEVAQQFFGAGGLTAPGVYTPAGVTSPVWTLTIAAPEPASLFLLGIGLPAVVGLKLRRKQAA